MNKNSTDSSIDQLIACRLKNYTNLSKHQVEPSSDFKERTMVKIKSLSKRKQIISDVLIAVIALAPLILREFWLFVRGDYFSITTLPMGSSIASTYQWLLASLSVVVLLALAASFGVFYLIKLRKTVSLSMLRISRLD